MNKPKVIIIIGMHRSGTSLTASLLQHSGLDIGQDLLGSGIGNTKGHYENVDFLNFHMHVLDELKHDNSGWDEIEIEKLDSVFEEEAKRIIEKNQSPLWGWKEPRTTLFVEFWAKLLPEAYFLFVYRSPVEVTDSFFRRATDAVIMEDPERAIDVWLHYNKLILKQYKKFEERSLLIHVKSFITAYPECIAAINNKFGLALNPEMKQVFDKELFHENSETQFLWGKLLYENKPEALQVYEELIRKSWSPADTSHVQDIVIKEERPALSRKLFFNQWKNIYAQEAQLKKLAAERITMLNEHESLHKAQQEEIREKKNLIEEKERAVAALQAEIDWMKKTKFWKLRTLWQKVKGV